MMTTHDHDTNGGCVLLSSYRCGYRSKFGVTRLLYVDRICLNACTVVPSSSTWIYLSDYALISSELHQVQRILLCVKLTISVVTTYLDALECDHRRSEVCSRLYKVVHIVAHLIAWKKEPYHVSVRASVHNDNVSWGRRYLMEILPCEGDN